MLVYLIFLIPLISSWWIPYSKQVELFQEYERREINRTFAWYRRYQIKSSYPMYTGFTLREKCAPNICDYTNNCRMKLSSIKDGDCVYLNADFLHVFVAHKIKYIDAKYTLITQNADVSTPDGQNSKLSIRYKAMYEASFILKRYHNAGRLLSFHGVNLWWNTGKVDP